MAIQIKHNVLVQISSDTDGKDKRYYPDSQETTLSGFDRSSVKDIQVAAAAIDVINFQDITLVKGMYLEVDGDIDLIINGSATAVPLVKGSTAAGTKARFFMEGDITALSLDNSGGAAAVNGVLVMWGDPSA